MNDWIDVTTSKPENGTRVLCTDGKQIQIALVKNQNSLGWFVGSFSGDAGSTFSPEPYSYDEYIKPTHWMELPSTTDLPSNTIEPESTPKVSQCNHICIDSLGNVSLCIKNVEHMD